MSVKVVKTGQVKTWVSETVKNIQATIEKSDVRFDLNLLPNEIHKTIDSQTVTRRGLIPLILGDTDDFTKHIDLIQFWPNGIPKEIQEYLKKLIEWLSYLVEKSDKNPIRIPLSTGDLWALKGFLYKVEYKNQIRHSSNEEELLVLGAYNKENNKFEQLKRKYKSEISEEESFLRERIPESVRIAVWRRDDGKCARCGSREKLEYDHIVPVSKGGGNTARNIELLCESCNRRKSNNIE